MNNSKINKLIKVLYYIVILFLYICIIGAFVNLLLNEFTFFKNYLTSTGGYDEAYSMFNEINRNISLILGVVIFSLISIIGMIVSFIFIIIEIFKVKIGSTLRIGFVLTNFMTISYINSFLITYGFKEYNFSIVVLLSIIIILITLLYNMYGMVNDDSEKIPQNILRYILLTVLAFGIASFAYVLTFKGIIGFLDNVLLRISENGYDFFANHVETKQTAEQLYGYVESFAEVGTFRIVAMIETFKKIEIISLIVYIFMYIYVLYKKEYSNQRVAILLTACAIIIIGATLIVSTPNLIDQQVLGGCTIC